MDNKHLMSLAPDLIKICISAVMEIMKIRHSKRLGMQVKLDDTYVTLADIASHNHILSRLQILWPELKVVSE